MKRLVSQCPVCQQSLKIAALQCPDCGLELRNNFEMSVFDQLSSEQYDFLRTFLKHRGNLKNLQTEMQISVSPWEQASVFKSVLSSLIMPFPSLKKISSASKMLDLPISLYPRLKQQPRAKIRKLQASV